MRLKDLFEAMRVQEIVSDPKADLSEFAGYGYWLAPTGKLINVDKIGGHVEVAKAYHRREPVSPESSWVRIMSHPSDPEFNVSFGKTITEQQFSVIAKLIKDMSKSIFYDTFTIDYVGSDELHKWTKFDNEKSFIGFLRSKRRIIK